MARRDAYYTPPEMAAALVSLVPSLGGMTVADYAAGDGALLLAAEHAGATVVLANDISRKARRALQQLKPQWPVAMADVLKRTTWPQSFEKVKPSLVVMNPPFSGRGGTYLTVEVAGKTGAVKCSRAMAFVLTATDLVSVGGHIACLLPESCIHSEKDAAARAYLSAIGTWRAAEKYEAGSFCGCASRVVSVLFQRERREAVCRPAAAAGHGQWQASGRLVRGTIQMHVLRRARKGVRFVHSTDLDGERIDIESLRCVHNEGRTMLGPGVLLPRVGVPRPAKICILPTSSKVALSDCVIGIRCDSLADAKGVRSAILENWSAFSRQYVGTGAPFVTLGRLIGFLETAVSPGARTRTATVEPNRAARRVVSSRIVVNATRRQMRVLADQGASLQS